MPTPSQCDSNQFKDEKDGGFQKITRREFNDYRENYRNLLELLKTPEPERSQKLPTAVLKTILKTQGYYLGKKQLKCLLDKDFAEYEGIRVTLGLTVDPDPDEDEPTDDTAIGKLVFLVEGVFPSSATEWEGTVRKRGIEVDARFHKKPRSIVYMAGARPEDSTPGPGSRESPPY